MGKEGEKEDKRVQREVFQLKVRRGGRKRRIGGRQNR